MCDARMWTDDVRALLLKHGLDIIDADVAQDDSIASMAARALSAAEGPLLAIGFSMGGIVALEMARQAQGRVLGLVLIDTNATADLPERAAVRPGQQARVRDGQLATIVADEMKPIYLAAENRGDVALKDLLFDMAIGLGPDVFCAQSEALRTRADNVTVLGDFAGPILILCGAEDRLCPPDWHRAMARRAPRATLAVIDGAGHMLPLEQPDAFGAMLGHWLDDNHDFWGDK